MRPTLRPRVKICCMRSRAEAALAIDHGASAIGLVGAMPSGPGPIDDQLIAEIARSVPPPVATFLLSSCQSVAGIVAHHRRTRTSVIQIVDELLEGTYLDLRDELPGVKLVKVIHVSMDGSVDRAVAVSAYVDALLLDSGRPDLAVKELGGTGRTHDWRISRLIREVVDIPVFLAGGLRPENVREAIDTVSPFGIDLCSGVRSGDRLDPVKLSAFMKAAGI
jgi:phosphoribosylanthranilate isomerase